MFALLCCSKYDRVFAAYETNTGKPHPLAAGRGPQIARRSTGSAPLIDNDGQLWYGDVGVGTPAVTFTIGTVLSRPRFNVQ